MLMATVPQLACPLTNRHQGSSRVWTWVYPEKVEVELDSCPSPARIHDCEVHDEGEL